MEWKVVSAAEAFHERGHDAGSAGDADDDRTEQRAGGLRVVVASGEVGVEQRADVGRQDAVEESGHLEAEGDGIRQETDEGGSNDERGKERNHGGICRGLANGEYVVLEGRTEGPAQNIAEMEGCVRGAAAGAGPFECCGRGGPHAGTIASTG